MLQFSIYLVQRKKNWRQILQNLNLRCAKLVKESAIAAQPDPPYKNVNHPSAITTKKRVK